MQSWLLSFYFPETGDSQKLINTEKYNVLALVVNLLSDTRVNNYNFIGAISGCNILEYFLTNITN